MTINAAAMAYRSAIDGNTAVAPALGRRLERFAERDNVAPHIAPATALRAPIADAPSWFAVVTRSKHERKVLDQLQSRDVESFLPFVQRWSRWRDRRKLIEWPLFPGYCFVRCSMHNMRSVLACRGVVHLVSFGARPTPVPDYEIDGIRRLLASMLPHDPCPFIDVGSWVEVIHGPLRGVHGRLVRKDQSTTLVVAIEMLGRALRVSIDAADVRAAGAPS
jgi:transcription antitermination factor NusG